MARFDEGRARDTIGVRHRRLGTRRTLSRFDGDYAAPLIPCPSPAAAEDIEAARQTTLAQVISGRRFGLARGP